MHDFFGGFLPPWILLFEEKTAAIREKRGGKVIGEERAFSRGFMLS